MRSIARVLMRLLVLVIAAAPAALAFGAPAAQADTLVNAKYDGTVDGGGTVGFTAWSDRTVSGFSANAVPGQSATGECAVNGFWIGLSVPINADYSFAGGSAEFPFSGLFTGTAVGLLPQQAQGTLSLNHEGCVTGTKNWTASTTATLPLPAPADVTKPRVGLRYAKSQTLGQRGIIVRVRCNEPCAFGASGSVSVMGRHRSYDFRPLRRQLAGGAWTTFRFTLSGRALGAVRTALRRHARATAYFGFTADDNAHNLTSGSFRVRLR